MRLRLVLSVALVSATALGPLFPSVPAGAHGGDLVPDEAVVQFRDAIPGDVDALVAPWGVVELRVPELRFVGVQTTPSELPHLLAAMAARGDVERAYQARYATLHFTPNDPAYPQQWGPPAIGMPAAWDAGLGGHGVRVAVLDTGVDYLHADLRPNTFLGDTGCGPDLALAGAAGPLAVDDNGHGTHVSGTVAAVTNNGAAVAGMSQACLQEVKVCTALGICTWQTLAAGIVHAALTGADVISMSLGGNFNDPVVEQAVQLAWAEGVLLVASAGNSGCGGDTVGWPARYPEVIAVASLAAPGTVRSGFSSCGPDVEIAAPGSNIVSTCLGGSTCSKSGTSMAAPHVSGVAALVKSAHPGLGHAQLRCVLQNTADDLGAAGRDTQFGFGRLDAAQALAAGGNPASVGC